MDEPGVFDAARKRCPKCGVRKLLAEFGKNRAEPDGLHIWCNTCRREYERQYREDNPEIVRGKYQRWHDKETSRALIRRLQNARRAKYREQVLTHYSPSSPPCCACCGATERLTIDHADGNGTEHRQELFGDKHTGGHHFYRWLVAQGFPPGYQVLCMRCNNSKKAGSRCRLEHGI